MYKSIQEDPEDRARTLGEATRSEVWAEGEAQAKPQGNA